MDRFSKLNPKAVFLFFALQLILSLLLFNPFYLTITFSSSLLYNIKLEGKAAVKRFFTFLLPLILFVSLFNMLFSHYGETVIFSAFSYNFTAESLFYGFNQSLMLASIITILSNYSQALTSEKFLGIFSGAAPKLSMLFSMVLSFLPRLKKNAGDINDARKNIDSGESKLKKSISSFSALITMTLEESIEVSDSMKARGYSKNRRTYSKYTFCWADFFIIFIELLLFIITLFYKIQGKTTFIFEPVVAAGNIYAFPIFAWAVMSLLPLIIDFSEDLKWLLLKQKI